MSRGTPTAERESKRKARTNVYLDSQLKKLREKLSNAKTTKEKQRIRASISSLKNRLGPKTRKDFIRSRNPLTKTKRGLRIRPKKVEKKSKIRKVEYTPTVGKVEEKSTNNTSNNNQQSQNKSSNNKKLKIKATTKGGPVKSGVEYARSKGDDLAGFRRQKDTRITKKLKKSGFTEDRLARLRKKNAAFQKAKKGGKKAMEEYRKKYPKRG